MSEKILDVKKDAHGFVTVTMNRPDVHNAFDDVLIKKMTAKLQEIDRLDDVRAVIIRGAGKSFSAGADLNWMRRMADYSWEQNYQDSLALASLMSTLANMRKTTIAAVQGAAFGGGVGLVACCDFAIASNKAKFCLSEVKLGLIPAVISPYVVAAIGKRNANRLFVTAEVFNGEQARDFGLVSEVVDIEEFDAHLDNLLAGIAKNGPDSIYAAKNLIRLVADKDINEEVIRETATRIADQRASKEGKEGVSAFLEKRQPSWIKE